MYINRIIYNTLNFFFDKFVNKSKDENIIMSLKNYESDISEEFLRDFREIILFTYRYNFKNILSLFSEVDQVSSYLSINLDPTTDVGWGCMIRVAQMSITQGIRVYSRRIKRNDASVDKLITNFQDNNSSAFSIHSMVSKAYHCFGIPPFTLIGPTTSSVIADLLINENKEILGDQKISSIAFKDGTLYKNPTRIHFSKVGSGHCTFIWLCAKLGTTKFNVDEYKHSIILLMKQIPQFACISGGHNNFSRALLIVGASRNYLYCLDPHTKILPLFSEEKFNREEFIQKKPTKISWEDLSPSVSFVFVCNDFSDFEEMCFNLEKINSNLFEVLDYESPSYNTNFETDLGFLVL